jgi:hypothetical protein
MKINITHRGRSQVQTVGVRELEIGERMNQWSRGSQRECSEQIREGVTQVITVKRTGAFGRRERRTQLIDPSIICMEPPRGRLTALYVFSSSKMRGERGGAFGALPPYGRSGPRCLGKGCCRRREEEAAGWGTRGIIERVARCSPLDAAPTAGRCASCEPTQPQARPPTTTHDQGPDPSDAPNQRATTDARSGP